jgi:hypothetical protein
MLAYPPVMKPAWWMFAAALSSTGCFATTDVVRLPATRAGEGELLMVSREHGPTKLGSCGPYRDTDRYDIALLGPGPRYGSREIVVRQVSAGTDAAPLTVDGAVVVDAERQWVTIDLRLLDGRPEPASLPINGTHPLHTAAF